MKNSVYMNRELSWLKFNERVLEEAESQTVPLCERLSFASIYQTNLDEFFMVRVGSLVDQLLVSKDIRDNKTKMTPKEQISAILSQVAKLNRRKDSVYSDLMEQIEEYGIKLVNFRKIDKKGTEYLERYFDSEIAPLISPTVVGKRQPFPFLRNREIYAVVVLQRKNGKEKLGLIPCGGSVFPRLIEVPGQDGTYMLSEELILHFIPKAFPGYFVKAKSLIRVTRNADIDADALYDEDLDYREFMVEVIKKRKRLAPVRLELSRELDGDIVDTLCDYLGVNKKYVFRGECPLDLSFVFQIQDMLRNIPELFYEKRVPQKSAQFQSEMPILQQIEEKDKLLSYPFESIRPFLNMLREAFSPEEDGGCSECADADLSVKSMLVMAVATSIDALAVGISLAMAGDVAIFAAVGIIGVCTFTLSAVGVGVGSVFGSRFEQKAQIAGGVILVILGVKILLEHLGVLV